MDNLLPTYSRDINSPLAALSICHINLQGDCDFAKKIRTSNYIESWRHPAPHRCSTEDRKPDIIIENNRLGLDGGVCTELTKKKI